MQLAGYYHDGETSRRYSARLEVNPTHSKSIKIHVDYEDDHHELVVLDFGELKIESRLGNTPRELSFGNGQLFVTENNDAIDSLIEHYSGSKAASLLHKLESKLTLVLLASVISIALVWSFVVYGIPVAAKVIADKMPTFTTEKLGSGLDILDRTVFDPSELEEARRKQILTLLEPYVSEHQDLNPKIVFRSGMKANALALPGGEIVFTDDLVNLVENDDELLAVFFHELGHLQHKHITRRILQDSMIILLVLFITGDVESVDLLAGIPTLVLDLSYSRQFEVEADTFALEEMHRANISLEHFASIMLRLENTHIDSKANEDENAKESDKSAQDQGYDIPDFLSTHPSTRDRVKLTEQYIKKYRRDSID